MIELTVLLSYLFFQISMQDALDKKYCVYEQENQLRVGLRASITDLYHFFQELKTLK